MNEIHAVLPRGIHQNAKQPNNKQLIHALSVVGYGDKFKGIREVVCARFWMGKSSSSSVVHCCLWVYFDGVCLSGKGSAGGGGYCKKSAALDEACRSAGISIRSRASDTWVLHGSGCIREACEAIAEAAGYSEILTVTHG
jgi:hypothetical protein